MKRHAFTRKAKRESYFFAKPLFAKITVAQLGQLKGVKLSLELHLLISTLCWISGNKDVLYEYHCLFELKS